MIGVAGSFINNRSNQRHPERLADESREHEERVVRERAWFEKRMAVYPVITAGNERRATELRYSAYRVMRGEVDAQTWPDDWMEMPGWAEMAIFASRETGAALDEYLRATMDLAVEISDAVVSHSEATRGWSAQDEGVVARVERAEEHRSESAR